MCDVFCLNNYLIEYICGLYSSTGEIYDEREGERQMKVENLLEACGVKSNEFVLISMCFNQG